jgi:hypothetical protein
MLKLGDQIIELKKESPNEFGIKNLKDISEGILKALKKFKERAEDGLSWWEKIRTGLDFGQLGGEILGELEELKKEILDLKEYEMRDLAKHIAHKLNLTYEDSFKAISEIVIESLNVVLSGMEIYRNVTTLLK